VFRRILRVVLVVGLLLTGCEGDLPSNTPEPTAISSPETVEPEAKATPPQPWQEAYAEILWGYNERAWERAGSSEARRNFIGFLLHDFDMDGTPELIVAGNYDTEDNGEKEIDVVYAFRDGEVVELEYGEDLYIARFALAAKGGATITPDNTPGLITYFIGSGSMVGASRWYQRIILDGDKLVLDAYGASEIDLKALYELFDDLFYADTAALSAATREHTHTHINDTPASKEELHRMFGEEERLRFMEIHENNIRDLLK
jgi:hypothetical protein